MSNPEHFRIDCLIEPFLPRVINGLQFEKAFDNPLKPTTPTGLNYVGPLHDHQVALYHGLHDVFPITRLGADEETAFEAHEKLKAERAAVYAPRKVVPAPAPKPVAPPPVPEPSPPPAPEGDSGNGEGKGEESTEAPPPAPAAAKGKAAKDSK